MLLIVIFNLDGFYDTSMAFIRTTYGQAFAKIVFYGPGLVKEPLPAGVFPYKQGVGKMGPIGMQNFVVHAMKTHNNFDGYFWMGDDVWVNYPRLFSEFDPNKVWMTPVKPSLKTWLDPKKAASDWHWKAPWGLPAVRRNLPRVRKEFIANLNEELGKPGMIGAAPADAGYIPHRFARDFIEVCELFNDTIFEIAFPMALVLISPKSERQMLKSAYLWLPQERSHPWDFWNVDTCVLHPLKLSNPQLKDYAVRWLEASKKQFHPEQPTLDARCHSSPPPDGGKKDIRST